MSEHRRGVAHRENAEVHAAVRHATARGALQRLTTQHDALRAAVRSALRVAEHRADDQLADRVERVAEDAAGTLAEAARRVLALRGGDGR